MRPTTLFLRKYGDRSDEVHNHPFRSAKSVPSETLVAGPRVFWPLKLRPLGSNINHPSAGWSLSIWVSGFHHPSCNSSRWAWTWTQPRRSANLSPGEKRNASSPGSVEAAASYRLRAPKVAESLGWGKGRFPQHTLLWGTERRIFCQHNILKSKVLLF